MTAPSQQARAMALVANEIDAYMRRPCSPAPAHGLTPMQCITPLSKALANAEWKAMDARGNLPADWPERKAALIEQLTGKPATVTV